MSGRNLGRLGLLGLAVSLAAASACADTVVPLQGPPEIKGGPGWYRMGSTADPEGVVPLSRLTGKGEMANTEWGRKQLGKPAPAPAGARALGDGGPGEARADGGRPGCAHTVICFMDGTQLGGVAEGVERIVWRPNLGYRFTYPFDGIIPKTNGEVSAAAVDSKGDIWALQRAPADKPALYKIGAGPNHRLLFAVDPAVTNHAGAGMHGMSVDAQDNVWICQQANAIVQKFSPDGKLLMTLGVRGRRGDWDESKGQHLLWEPVAIDFGPNGDIYIFEGHEDESPNDVGSADTANRIGSARVVHLDKDGKFINQWYGNDYGPGKFYNSHGGAVDPLTGDVWIGDRQDYRIVIFTANGRFLRTIQMRNLTSVLFFDKHKGPGYGQLWMGTGQDAQVLKLTRDGKVLGAIGTRKDERPEGRAFGQTDRHFGEASYMGIDRDGNMYVGDTINPRLVKLVPPSRR